jgi:hypothetical protein
MKNESAEPEFSWSEPVHPKMGVRHVGPARSEQIKVIKTPPYTQPPPKPSPEPPKPKFSKQQ